ncbi:MAG: helix-turn-helix transcriptional regulator [Bdellovibrionales bacterium]|nr:helix-turn-helix transcriptional regulator [Bdellovibrionales bacterium]
MNTKLNVNLSFGEFLKVHRQGEELSQTDFAKELGVSKQRLSDIEANRFNISIKLAKEIAKKLDLPAEWLVKLALQDQLRKERVKLKVG